MRFLNLLRPLIATAAFMAFAAGAHAAEFKNGIDFTTLDAVNRPETGKKVEVLEVFMYHCPHCNALEAPLADWVKKQGDKIVFRRMHLGEDAQAKAFFTLEAMNALGNGLHEKFFHAVHVEHYRLNTDQSILDFVVKNGVDKAKYLEFFNSFAVQTKMKRGVQVANQYKLDSAPALVIDGHYTTSPAVAGHGLATVPEAHAAMFAVMDSLVAKSAQERATKK
ncbi:thiol:disulfide interchange protein DsbA/DsbL [Duganella violaceipulchra]|uniref:Thiol:disulfide interchange protein n=1 Tax=Duganella violaceipulchra TaxID=2849652 RepID=A0AA41KZA6_9BURK|nr:thiol:disulfide interchange protein DsbA/DsbL [Duganella violaceicalia]MBV6320021.1 thiol:disulfide interchange protein DsbA/DsbL [Duganella violaceicalia]MCP2010385.1 thiol:disulfide interchange protein DsbA [Duganella violaceicalia]